MTADDSQAAVTNWAAVNRLPSDRIEILSVDLLDQNRIFVEDLSHLATMLGLEFGWHYLLDTIDATNFNITAAEVNRRTDPYVITLATNSCRRGFDQNKKKWMIEKVEEAFPQLNGRDVPVPLFSDKSYNYIEASRIRLLRPGEAIPRPYYP